MKKFERLAATIEDMIQRGNLPAGARLPSVRAISLQYGVSPSTVFKAYYLLEDRGLVTARERSGYYVNENIELLQPMPDPKQYKLYSRTVDVSQQIFSILHSIQNQQLAPLASAFPAQEFFPLPQLAREFYRANKPPSPYSATAGLSPGLPELRQQIQLRYQASGINVDLDEIVITNGAMEALNLCLQAVTTAGDTVVLESPTFYAALQAVERLQLKAIEIPTTPGLGIDLTSLEKVLKKQSIAACWLMTNFQNPTGTSMPEDRKRQLVQLLQRHRVPLLEDDVYGELYFGKHYPHPAKRHDRHGRVLHCGSFSKSLAPGYRIGWAAAGRYAETIQRSQIMSSLGPSVPAQLAVTRYLQKGSYERHLRKLRYTLESQKHQMLRAIAAHFPPQTRVTQPEGGYFLWLELPAHIDNTAFYVQALQAGISLTPGSMFSNHPNYQHCLRINYGQDIEASIAAIKQLGKILTSL